MAFVITFLPTFVVVYFMTHGSFALGINLVFFIVSVLLAMVINYCV